VTVTVLFTTPVLAEGGGGIVTEERVTPVFCVVSSASEGPLLEACPPGRGNREDEECTAGGGAEVEMLGRVFTTEGGESFKISVA